MRRHCGGPWRHGPTHTAPFAWWERLGSGPPAPLLLPRTRQRGYALVAAPEIMLAMSSWRDYESEIYDLLTAKAEPGAVIEFDVQRPGHLSGTNRQIDVWLEGTLAGGVLPDQVSLAVDCKCWSSTVNVPDVERFIGTLDDIGADIGFLVTTTGFSHAARTRAKRARGLQLEVLTFEELAEWSPMSSCVWSAITTILIRCRAYSMSSD
jgi:hypothetical protein